MTSVMVAGARTPMGRLLGAFKDMPAVELGAVAIRAALERAGLNGDQVDHVVFGHVLQAGTGQLTARQAAVAAGIPMTVPAVTVNRVCLSGLDTIVQAAAMIDAGDAEIVVAGGMESMTRAPHLLPGLRGGVKYGDGSVTDSMELDGLWDAFTDASMGRMTERANADGSAFGRREQDAYAARSHQRAARAAADGIFDAEIVEVDVKDRKGTTTVRVDEGIRPDTTVEVLARLRPAYTPDGTITAGSSSPISDGACAVVVASAEAATRLGLVTLAEIGPHATVAGPDSTLQLQPANAIRRACLKADLTPRDLDLIEINEAFAAVVLASLADLDLGPDAEDKVNACGGAIALGHPLGMSGARVALHLALELRRLGGERVGAAALCGGGGQGEALILRTGERA